MLQCARSWTKLLKVISTKFGNLLGIARGFQQPHLRFKESNDAIEFVIGLKEEGLQKKNTRLRERINYRNVSIH